MRISIIAAMSDNRVIGRDNRLPWHLPADLKHFMQLTMGKPIIMGRKTYESMDGPLPGRENIVLTRQGGYQPDGATVFDSLDKAIDKLRCLNVEEVFIGGGTEVYRQGMEVADRIYLTVIHREYEGDAFFPPISEQMFELCESECHYEPLPFEFQLYERK